MRIAVTGGAGYIGSVVVDTLVRKGADVVVLDNLSKGHRDAVVDGAEFVELDLHDARAVADLFQRARPDAVVHLAADSLVGQSMTDPAKYYASNVVAGLNLLEAMRRSGARRLVYSSTAAVYGDPTEQPITEAGPTCPTNPYGETKLALERALRWYGQAYGLSSISLRYFNAAGATERCGERHSPETHLIPLVLGAAAGDSAGVTIFGDDYPTRDGTCVRDYVHVQDLADAHVLALDALERPGMADVYNLGCGSGYSVREVIAAAERVAETRIPVSVVGRRPGDPAVLVASSDRIRQMLGWTPRFDTLDAIVGSAWRWMMAHTRP